MNDQDDSIPDLPPAPIQPFTPDEIAAWVQKWPSEFNEHSMSAMDMTWEHIPRLMATILALGNTTACVPELIEERQKAMDVLAVVLKEKAGVPLRIYKRTFEALPEKWEIEYTPLGDGLRVRLIDKTK